MHGTIPRGRKAAITATDKIVGSPTEVSEEKLDGWFVVAAQSLLAPKPGFILDIETGCGERNGDRYTSGAVKLPLGVFRCLLHSPHGRQWLNAIMDGCEQDWWLEHQRAERLKSAIDSTE